MSNKHNKAQQRRFRRRKLTAVFLLVAAIAILLGPFAYVYFISRDVRVAPSAIGSLSPRPVAIVFGAGVWPDGTPTPYLQNRLDTSVELFTAGKVETILVSGDNSTKHYNEPEAMRRYLVSKNVPEDKIVQDFGGLNTYDTCYRAKSEFKVTSAYVVTQSYHLPRAVMTCRVLGVDSIGVEATRQGRDFTASYLLRELASMYKAGAELVLRPEPLIKGSPEPAAVIE